MQVTRLDAIDGGRERGGADRARLLIADHAATRLGIRMALGADVHVCAEAGDTEGAIRAAKREQPEVALVGCETLTDWRAAVRGIRRAAPGCAVVVLTPLGDVEDMLEAVRAGAIGYLPGPVDAQRLRRVVQAVADKEAVVPRKMAIDLLSELRDGRSAGDELTRREVEVLGMLRRGHSTVWIADRLQIAPVTVRRHISVLVRKLGAESRSDLLARDAS